MKFPIFLPSDVLHVELYIKTSLNLYFPDIKHLVSTFRVWDILIWEKRIQHQFGYIYTYQQNEAYEPEGEICYCFTRLTSPTLCDTENKNQIRIDTISMIYLLRKK